MITAIMAPTITLLLVAVEGGSAIGVRARPLLLLDMGKLGNTILVLVRAIQDAIEVRAQTLLLLDRGRFGNTTTTLFLVGAIQDAR